MRRAAARRLGDREAGFTLVELLVASTMGVILLGAVGSLLISGLRNQPGLTQKAANISTARWALERMTRELRDGISVDKATASSVSFKTYVRHTACGITTALPSTSASIKCEVTYTCSGSACTRLEAESGVYTGAAATIFEGINNSSSVFTYSPNSTSPTYVGVTLAIPDPSGSGATTVSDGVSLRNATLSN